jgi:hypothetical protein
VWEDRNFKQGEVKVTTAKKETQQEIQFGTHVVNLTGLPGRLVGIASLEYFSVEEVQGLNPEVDCIVDGDAGVIILMAPLMVP